MVATGGTFVALYRRCLPSRCYAHPNFDSHKAKAIVAQTPLITVMSATAPKPATLFAGLEAAGAKVNDAKSKALYVDVAADGELSEPDDVPEAAARAAVEQLAHALNDSRAMGLTFGTRTRRSSSSSSRGGARTATRAPSWTSPRPTPTPRGC